MTHDFRESLEYSKLYQDAAWWEEVYRNFFRSNYAGMFAIEGLVGQLAGIDRVITLKCGRTVTVDEKVRSQDWDDFALERWSDKDRRTPGWIQKDLFCDYIAYAFIPSRRCFLLPFLDLRRAWIRFGPEWCERFPKIHSPNNGYVTECVTVPIAEVLRAIQAGALYQWKEQEESKP